MFYLYEVENPLNVNRLLGFNRGSVISTLVLNDDRLFVASHCVYRNP